MSTGSKKVEISPAEKINPSAMTVDQAAALLKITAATVGEHIAAGLPVDGQGRIHLIEYVAWMVQRLVNKNGDDVVSLTPSPKGQH